MGRAAQLHTPWTQLALIGNKAVVRACLCVYVCACKTDVHKCTPCFDLLTLLYVPLL